MNSKELIYMDTESSLISLYNAEAGTLTMENDRLSFTAPMNHEAMDEALSNCEVVFIGEL